jgi:hypothetical protein
MDPFAPYAAWAYPLSVLVALPPILSAAATWIFRGRYSREARRDQTVFAIAGFLLMGGALAWALVSGAMPSEQVGVLWMVTLVLPPLLGALLILTAPLAARTERYRHVVSTRGMIAWGLVLVLPMAIGLAFVFVRSLTAITYHAA